MTERGFPILWKDWLEQESMKKAAGAGLVMSLEPVMMSGFKEAWPQTTEQL